jgi:hypothetical protein
MRIKESLVPANFLNLKGFTGSMKKPAVLWVVIYFSKT